MNPKQLKFPYSWENRQPCLSEGVLFVPGYYERHQNWVMPTWEAIFLAKRPLAIEYCSGNGHWIIEQAKKREYNWIAVEKRFDRVQKIWSKMKNAKLDNLLIVCGEAITFSTWYLPALSVQEMYVNFPDPWPKERHAKNRLFQNVFVQQLYRISKEGSNATIVTDDVTYAGQIMHEMHGTGLWKSRFPDPYFLNNWPDYGTSYFDSLWRSKGRSIYYFQFGKV